MIQNVSRLIKGTPITQDARRIVLDLLNIAFAAVDPQILVNRVLKLKKHTLHLGKEELKLDDITGIYIIGAGKATGRMAEAVEAILKDNIVDGLIIVPEPLITEYTLNHIHLEGGGHPEPTTSSIKATQHLLDLLDRTPDDALILSLFSGGGSALLSLPCSSITLQDLQHTTTLLLRSGLPIQQINTVRKHLSQVKGGQLAQRIHPRLHWALLISDVPHDQLDLIASGPTLPDPTTFSDVARIFDKYHLWNRVPVRVQDHITAGLQGQLQDTPKPNNSIFSNSVHGLIGRNQDACQAVLNHARQAKYDSRILTTNLQGEARDVGDKLGRLAQSLASRSTPQTLIFGSETTVTVRHEGKGGRNTELVTAILPYLHGIQGLVVASLATDGIDGPTDTAGAIADGDSYHRAHSLNLSPKQLLETNNTYQLFQALGDLLITGPTHTNVRDITIIHWQPQHDKLERKSST